MVKYTRLNNRFAIIEFPATLSEMKEISLDLPKSERAFYEFAFKSLEKTMNPGEKILFFDVADPSLTKTGFIVIGERCLYLVSMKGGLTGGAETEAINYDNIMNVDFDIAPVKSAAMNPGILFLKGTRQKRTLRNISESNINQIVSLIRSKSRSNLTATQSQQSSSTNDEKKEGTDAKTRRLIREKHPGAWLVESASIGEKLITGEYGAFTKDRLIIYKLAENDNLIKTGEMTWPVKESGDVDHFAIKSIFTIGGFTFVTGNHGKDVQRFLEGEKEDSFTKVARSFYQKIPGFRTKKRWKQIVATLMYLFLFSTFATACFGGDTEDPLENDTAKNNLSSQEKTSNETTDEKETTTPVAVTNDDDEDKTITATVLDVTDGDTIKVDVDGKEETVRLILVDTPETKHPKLGKQPLGEEAAAFTTDQLSGKEIKIEPGIEERDQYGRLLAYVYVDDKMFNKTLVEEGFARVAVYPPNTEHLEELETVQTTAKEKGIGIWEVENYAKEDGYDADVYEPEPEPVVVSEPEPVVEEEPEPVVVDEPEPQQESVYYDNCTAARAAGAAPVHQSEPGYGKHLDRDGDGIGCDK